MDAKRIFTWTSTKSDNWILKLGLLSNEEFIASTSSGSIVGYSLAKQSPRLLYSIEGAHESSINDLKVINEHTIATCSTDGVKIWDLRANQAIAHLTNSKNSNFLSLAYDKSTNRLAAGTELNGADAEVHVWDLNSSSNNVVKSFIDSHHDDVTSLEFHPTLQQYLMSGSTDGYVNIYDLSAHDEDEALHQVINFGSVHSCHFVSESRISILSHIETLMFHDLNDTNYENLESPNFNDIGDLRVKWPKNEYVVEIFPSGFAAYGSNSEQSLIVLPFNPRKEKFKEAKAITFPGAHGEDVVRDVLILPEAKRCLTCGEDGKISLWELPYEMKLHKFGPSRVTTEETKNLEKNGSKTHRKSRKERRFKPY